MPGSKFLYLPIIFVLILGACTSSFEETTSIPLIQSTEELQPVLKNTSTPSQAPSPIATLIIPSRTANPTPDYSQIKWIGSHEIWLLDNSFTQVIIDVGTLQGHYFGMADGENFRCEYRTDYVTQINCFGPIMPHHQSIEFMLFMISQTEPIFTNKFKFLSPLPTPIGMTCEIEGLWTELVGKIGEIGCYAVTCWVDGEYYGGTSDSCKVPWPWIPPGLIPTATPSS